MNENSLDLSTLLRENKNALTNREGERPLLVIAKSIAKGSDKYSKDHAVEQILNLEIANLDIEEIAPLLSFIHYSEINTDNVERLVSNCLKSHFNSNNEEDSLKRGLLLRFVIERNNSRYSLKQLLEENTLRNRNPWIWIDCMSYLNWDWAVNEISKIVGNGDSSFKNLFLRIPSFQKRLGKEKISDALMKWYPNLNKRDRAKLDSWARQLELKVGLSLSAENLINNVSLYQDEILV